MKLLIFENEFVYVESAFNYINELHFNKELIFEVYASSQDFKNFNGINNFDLVFIDISLAKKSDLDGYGLLKKMKELKYNNSKIIILTGNHRIKEFLKEKGIVDEYKILTKPIEMDKLLEVLKSV